MPGTATMEPRLEERVAARLRRRTWPIVVSALFFCLAMVYFFRWGPVVEHVQSSWESPGDLWGTYNAAVAFIHGHFGSVYTTDTAFLAFPGMLVALSPIAALNGSLRTTLVEVAKNHHFIANPQTFLFSGTVVPPGMAAFGKTEVATHPQVFILLAPFTVLISCLALFACDALAERLDVGQTRRAALAVVEAAVLWNVTVTWGHPQDAVALALAVYAVIFAMDDRFTGAGWLIGVALAFQPLVIVIFPILLAVGGRQRAAGVLIRGVIPAAAVTVVPVAAAFHATTHALISEPTFPHVDHATPWTVFAPKLGGKGRLIAVGGGPVRLVSLALAVGVGWWARRWRAKPEMLVWAVALALALRCYTESVMTPYYIWPSLAIGLVVGSRCRLWRFAVAAVAAVATTFVAQSNLGEFPWWALVVTGITIVLVVTLRPEAPAPLALRPEPAAPRPVAAQGRARNAVAQKNTQKKQRRKKARSDRKRTAVR